MSVAAGYGVGGGLAFILVIYILLVIVSRVGFY
ncbi:sporulation protein YjcZ [Ammoniphilus sp. CFH 90114]|nr:sporulation protein YjcZ [Ammoniphilus sp. CFH 90114]RXT04925.1 sporulation protein YjcZ [Ammoniphilus sp. CFH 90114]